MNRYGAPSKNLGLPVCIHDSGSPYLPSFGERMETHTSGHIIAHPFEAMVVDDEPDLVRRRRTTSGTAHRSRGGGRWLVAVLAATHGTALEFSGNAEHPQLTKRPTEYFKSNFLVACRGDEMTLPAVCDLVGDDYVTFNTDYPHPDGTWPAGMGDLEKQPLSEASIRKIFWDNAAPAFGVA